MNDILNQLKNLWNNMNRNRKILVVSLTAAVLIAVIVLIRIAGTPKYELLYARLTEQDRSEIIAKLDELKIPYRTSAGGGIEVPNALSVRASLLKEGIPRGGVVGWEIFDQNSFSATDFTNQINRQRAIAGELTRTLQRLDGILDAKILLNLPDQSEYIFADDKPEGTASVQLQLRAPGVLTQTQVEAILNLVAASTGIKQDNVTIIDNYANDLTAAVRPKKGRLGGGMGGTNNASDLLAAKLDYETTVEKRIESMLSKVFGFNKAVVRVNADLDLDYQELKSETFADKGVPRSEQEKSETYEGTGSSATGIPGTDSNITQYKATDSGVTNYKGEKYERTTNYEISKVEEFRVGAPGKVKRLTVGVWVDGNLQADIKQKVYNTVKDAVGVDETRGDRLSVETINFSKPAQPEKPVPIPWATIITATVLALLLIALIILVIIKEPVPPKIETIKVVKEKAAEAAKPEEMTAAEWLDQKKEKPEKHKKRSAEEVEVEEVPVPIVGTKIDKMIEDTAQQEQAAGGTEEIVPEIAITLEERVRNERLEAIEKIAREKPAEVAVLLKAWLSDENN
ncbi:MAG: flagellar basal-body MS-ring/collar protein FliF [Bacillota bacterium]